MAGFTFSSTDRILACGHESALEDAMALEPAPERTDHVNAAAERGTAAHYVLETGDLAEAQRRWPEHADWLAKVRARNYCGPGELSGWTLEQARVLDVETALGWSVQVEGRDYPPTRTYELAGRLDLWKRISWMGKGPWFYVRDYKTGSSVPAPEWSGQLRVQALSLLTPDTPDDVEFSLGFILIGEDGKPEEPPAFATTACALRAWCMRVLLPAMRAYAKRQRPARPGDHCFFCPARRVCSAYRASPLVAWTDLPREDLFQRWRAAQEAVEDMKAALKKGGPVDAGGGKVWGPSTSHRLAVKNLPVLLEAAQRAAGDAGVPMTLDLDAAKREPWWAEAERVARDAGAVVDTEFQRWMVHKPRA